MTLGINDTRYKCINDTTVCHYAQCCYAKCCDLFTVILNVIILSVVMLNVMAPCEIQCKLFFIISETFFLMWQLIEGAFAAIIRDCKCLVLLGLRPF